MSHKKATDEAVLGELFDITVTHLIEKVKSGEATSQDIANIRGILKDNNIQIDPSCGEVSDLAEIAGGLPDVSSDSNGYVGMTIVS